MRRLGVAGLLALTGCTVPLEPEAEERVGVARAAISVDEAVSAGCSTTQVMGLSLQIIAQSNCIAPGAFVELTQEPNVNFGSAVLPYMEEPARDALAAALADNPSTQMQINSMLRTVAQQYLLYRWYQLGTCGVGLAATPGNSNHETGLAIDVQQYNTWKPILEAKGFAWLGANDPVHFDYVGPGAVDYRGTDVLAFQQLWNFNHPEAPIDEDGDYGPQTEGALKQAPAEGFAIGAECGEPVDGVVVSAVFVADDAFDDGPSLGIADLHEGESYVLEVTVRNEGDSALDMGTLSIEADEPLSPARSSVELGLLEPGSSQTVSIDVEALAYTADGDAATITLTASYGDESGSAVASADVYSDRRWTFDGGRLEGWVGGSIEEGALVATVADGPPVAVNASDVLSISLRARSDGEAALTLAYDGASLDDGTRLLLDIPADGAFHDITLSDLPDDGELTGLRFSDGALDELSLETLAQDDDDALPDGNARDAGCTCAAAGAPPATKPWWLAISLLLLRRRRRRADARGA